MHSEKKSAAHFYLCGTLFVNRHYFIKLNP